jgi:hypothetical protein
MVRRSIPRTRLAPALFVGLTFVALAGCQDEDVRHYRVPRAEPPSARLLAAVLPVGEKVWFVSVTGPAPAVAALKPQFEQFVQTIRFPENERRRVTWELPADWHRERSRERMRYATFRAGPNALEVKVHAFGRDQAGMADLLGNVNRWRGQLGLGPIAADELPSVSRPIAVNGVSGTFVDMTGPGASAAGATAPPMDQVGPAPPAAPETLGYDAPPGWEPVPVPPGSMRVAAFKVADGGQSAEVTVIPLAGQAGGLLSNVNRWRGQIGLPDTTEEQLRKEAKMLDSPAGPVVYVDLAGPKGRTLGGVLLHGGRSWFVKLQGPAELVGKRQAAFEAFLKSLRFAAGAK